MTGELKKSALVEKRVAVDGGELGLINKQSLRPLSEEEVYAFRFVAANTEVDRDYEHFSKKSLEKLAKLFVGRPVLRDHQWSADAQTARIYAGAVEPVGEEARLILRAYMLRSAQTEGTVAAIEAGILREVSVGCAVNRAVCSICGSDKSKVFCTHQRGVEYNGKLCTVELDDPTDAYECSLVAVPSQMGVGVVKRYGGEDMQPAQLPEPSPELLRALALLELENKRF